MATPESDPPKPARLRRKPLLSRAGSASIFREIHKRRQLATGLPGSEVPIPPLAG